MFKISFFPMFYLIYNFFVKKKLLKNYQWSTHYNSFLTMILKYNQSATNSLKNHLETHMG